MRLGVGAALAGLSGWTASAEETASTKPKSVAAAITVYFRNSHAGVLLTKILEGWQHDGGPGPALKLASIYIDQPEGSEFGLEILKKHGIPIFDSIEKAVTAGGKTIPVDGVLSIGEHGNYPENDLGQQLYPRKRFFQEITDTFQKFGRVVPVFNDKHISTVWEDAKWMYDRAVEMKMPFMAGSSLPVGYRSHPFELPMESDIESAVGIGYGGLDVYGFHALEAYQALIERRKNAERGVKWVRCLEGKEAWQAVDDGWVVADVMDAVYDVIPKSKTNIRAYAAPPNADIGWPAMIELPRANLMKYPGRNSGLLGPRYDALLRHLDKLRRGLDQWEQVGSLLKWDSYQRQALRFVLATRPGDQNPFDLTRESDAIRDLYGREEWGQGFLTARRLIEAGVRIVQVNLRGWDTHQNAFRDLKGKLLPSLDHCLSGFLDDLSDRGLLDETLVVMCGEMGRTPRISPITAGGKNAAGEVFTPGRHHWGDVFPCFFAGGGIQPGRIIGQTDAHGGVPVSDAFTPEHLAATIFHCLGIGPDREFHDSTGRPYRIYRSEPIKDLF